MPTLFELLYWNFSAYARSRPNEIYFFYRYFVSYENWAIRASREKILFCSLKIARVGHNQLYNSPSDNTVMAGRSVSHFHGRKLEEAFSKSHTAQEQLPDKWLYESETEYWYLWQL